MSFTFRPVYSLDLHKLCTRYIIPEKIVQMYYFHPVSIPFAILFFSFSFVAVVVTHENMCVCNLAFVYEEEEEKILLQRR